jgi:alpha-beta hydrolase superfamily lysophospholipase
MKHQEGHFKSIRNTNVYYQYWLPEGDPKAILLIVHGLAEHSGRYMNVVNHFVPKGYAVYGIDHIGHGKSDGKRVYVERFQDYTKTLKQYFDMIKGWQPGKPVFLIGHSMGGLISTAYLLEHQDELAGAILSGPGIKVPDNISKAVILSGKILSVVMPKAGIIQLDAESVSRDPAVVDAYITDPLVYTRKVTARLGAEMLKTMQHVTESAAGIRLPIMIVQGGADKLVDPSGTQMLYDSIGSEDKTIEIYDGFYHELFNEPEHGQVLDDVAGWIEAHLGVA